METSGENEPSGSTNTGKQSGPLEIWVAPNSLEAELSSEKPVTELSAASYTLNRDTYTVDDAVDNAGYGKFQKMVTFLAGIGWLADAFEVIILSIIGDMVACQWYIERWQNALMTSIVFVGMACGAPSFGNFADRYGRRTCLGVSTLLLFIFGAASAASPNYVWMVVLRGLMGFALGGMAQGVTLCCEYYPANMRGRAGFYLSYYWAVGTICLIGVAWLVMKQTDDWTIFVLLASLPALFVFLSMKWYPESARYFLVGNEHEKAVAIIKRMTKMNNKEMLPGRLIELNATEQKGKIQDLLSPALRRTTLLFWYMWLSAAFCYYGIALITPLITKEGSLYKGEDEANVTKKTMAEDFSEQVQCHRFTDREFQDLMWTSSAEIPGIMAFTFIVECCSRRMILGTAYLIMAFLLLMLMLKMEPKIALFIVLFIARGIMAGLFQLLFIMTTEAFPTTLRASAMGTGSGCARAGGALIPFMAQVTIINNPIPSMIFLSAAVACGGLAAFLLPLDTRGMAMSDTI